MAIPQASWVERFYTHFVARDLACVFAGSIVLTSGCYALTDNTWILDQSFIILAGYLVASYFTGMCIVTVTVKARIRPLHSQELRDWYEKRTIKYTFIAEKFGATAVLDIERSAFLAFSFHAITAATCVSILLLSLIWGLRWLVPWLSDVVGLSLPAFAQTKLVTSLEHIELLVPIVLGVSCLAAYQSWVWFRDQFAKRWTTILAAIDGANAGS